VTQYKDVQSSKDDYTDMKFPSLNTYTKLFSLHFISPKTK